MTAVINDFVYYDFVFNMYWPKDGAQIEGTGDDPGVLRILQFDGAPAVYIPCDMIP